MKNVILILSLFFTINIYSQTQISNFTYNNIEPISPSGYIECNNKIYFQASTDDFGRELWSSDGTSANTNMVVDIMSGVSDGLRVPEQSYFTILNNELYFVAKNELDYSGGEIWKTDGTESGSTMVTNYSGRICGLTAVDNQIFYCLKTDDNNLEVWKTDGTEQGTELIKGDIYIANSPSFQGSVNNTFIFTFQSPYSKVWRSDGTAQGTYALTEELNGNGSNGGTFDLSQYINYNDKLYFVTRYFLYESDGTIENTNVVANVWNAQNNLVTFGDVIEVNDKMYFLFYSMGLLKLSIYESDGTQSGTSEIYSITNDQFFYPSFLSKSDNNLLFTSANTTGGTSLFSLNTDNNTLSDIIEINQNPPTPPYFIGDYSACKIDKIDDTNFFLNIPADTFLHKEGWIYNESENTMDNIPILNNLHYYIVYNQDLYYSRNYQVWKFNSTPLSLDESISSSQSIFTYPNPTSDFIYFNQSEGITAINIYDTNGRLILSLPKVTDDKIDITKLSPNTYFLKFEYNNTVITKKIIKKF